MCGQLVWYEDIDITISRLNTLHAIQLYNPIIPVSVT